MINSKKFSGVFAIWLLLFAMFGPLASVSAAKVTSCENSGDMHWDKETECDAYTVVLQDLNPSDPGCFYDSSGIPECIAIPSNLVSCSECGGSGWTCGKNACVSAYGASRERMGYSGCRYDDGGLGSASCVEEEATGSSTSRAEKIEENGGKCFGPNKLTCVTCGPNDRDGKVECFVSGFELPQDPKTSWKDAGGWISGYKDPSYLVYYEAFPEGEEAAWQFPGNEMLYAGLIINGVLTVLHIKSVATVLKKAAKPVGDAATKAATRVTAKVDFLKFLNAAKGRVSSTFTTKIVAEATEGIVEPVAKKRVGKLSEYIWSSISRGADDVGVKASDDAVRESIEAVQKSSTGKSVAEMTDKDAVKFIDDLVDGDGTIDALVRGGGFSKAEAKDFVKFQREEYAEAVGYGVKRLNNIPIEKRKEIISRTWKTATTVWQKSPAARGWAMSVYDRTVGSDWADEKVAGDNEFLRNMKDWADMTMKASMVVSNPRAATKTGTGLKVAGIFALAGASISAELADEVLMKFSPEAGVNGMAMFMPFYPAQTIQLGDEAHAYYVQLVKDDGVFGTSVMTI